MKAAVRVAGSQVLVGVGAGTTAVGVLAGPYHRLHAGTLRGRPLPVRTTPAHTQTIAGRLGEITVTSFTDRPRTALLVIDVQEDVMSSAWQAAEVVARIGALVDRARAEGTPVVWVRHQDDYMPPDSQPWQIVAALHPSAREPIVEKRFRSAFEGTDLEAVLGVLDVGRLVVCGAQSDFCVRHTIHAALEKGYDVALASDVHTTTDAEIDGLTIPAELIVAHQNSATREYALPGRTSRIAPHDQIRVS